MIKNQPANAGDEGRRSSVPALDREDPLKKVMATHSSILAWRTPWIEEPGRLQSKESNITEQLTLSLSHFYFPGK